MEMTILIGLPGSGKTTYENQSGLFDNKASESKKWEYINQDILGSRDACLKKMEEAFKLRQNVVVDRCNFNKIQRKYFIDLGLEFGISYIKGIWLWVPEDECIARIHMRKDHPTIKQEMPLEEKMQIVYKFNKIFEPPEITEGFNEIVILKNY